MKLLQMAADPQKTNIEPLKINVHMIVTYVRMIADLHSCQTYTCQVLECHTLVIQRQFNNCYNYSKQKE